MNVATSFHLNSARLSRAETAFQLAAELCRNRRALRAGSLEPERTLMSFLPANYRPTRRKIFGTGKPQALDKNVKARIMHLARALMRRSLPGRAWGVLSAKAVTVLEALLFGFHGRSGLAFPSYEALAERAACARSTVAEAIKSLESVGLITWANRIVRVRDGGVVRVLRSSNSYSFVDPNPGAASKSDRPHATMNPDLRSDLAPAAPTENRRLEPVAMARTTVRTAASKGLTSVGK